MEFAQRSLSTRHSKLYRFRGVLLLFSTVLLERCNIQYVLHLQFIGSNNQYQISQSFAYFLVPLMQGTLIFLDLRVDFQQKSAIFSTKFVNHRIQQPISNSPTFFTFQFPQYTSLKALQIYQYKVMIFCTTISMYVIDTYREII